LLWDLIEYHSQDDYSRIQNCGTVISRVSFFSGVAASGPVIAAVF
jgi:hypothetical protein